MWQRIQTIFLALVAISMALMFFFPIWEKQSQESEEMYILKSYQMTHITEEGGQETTAFPYLFIGILAGIAAAVAVYEITRYDNRLTQMKLGALNSLLMAITLALSVYFLIQAEKEWMPAIKGEFHIGLFLPAIAMLFNLMANRFIRKDEQLVRSVDRIR